MLSYILTMKKLIAFYILIATIGLSAKSQSVNPYVIASAGNYYVGANAQLSWTLGEVVTSTFSFSGAIITQGFQQNTYTVVAINESSENLFNIKLFPNPTNGYFKIQWENIENTDILINVTNNQGIIIIKKTINSSENQAEIDLINYPISTYIITISTTNGNCIKHFKIIKK